MRKSVAGALAGVVAVFGYAVGRPTFSSLGLLPNLGNVPGTATECQVCHVSAGGGGTLNTFGTTVQANLTGGVPETLPRLGSNPREENVGRPTA